MSEEGNGATARLAQFVGSTRFQDLPPRAVHDAKRMICDSIACAVGARSLDSGSMVAELAAEMGGLAEATIMASRTRVSASAAAFANGYLGNALDADETLYNRGHHAVATVFPALAVAEQRKADGRNLIAGVVLGYDIGARIGSSLTYKTFTNSGGGQAINAGLGWISFAAAAAAAKVIGLDADQITHALGIAGWTSPLPAGLRWQQITTPKPMLKYAPYGFMSQQGVLAALLAAKGFTADPAILDGARGFWMLVGAASCDWDTMLGDLGKRWWVREASIKPYASGRYANFATDLFRKIISEHNLSAGEIDKVSIQTIATAASHWFNNPPQSQIDMPFNLPFAIAASAHRIELGPRWQSWETVRDPRLPEFARKVEVLPNTDLLTDSGEAVQLPMQGALPIRVPTQVRVHARGQVFSARTDFAWGDPWSPESMMSDEQLKQKFRSFCAGALRSDRIEEALDVIFRLDEVNDVGAELTPLLA